VKKIKKAPAKKPTTRDLSYIETTLRHLAVPIDSVTPDPKNAREHNTRNVEAVKRSLGAFKQQKPIVVGEDGVVIAGNGTLLAAKELGWTHIAAVRSALNKNNRTAFAVADNRTAELAGWDYEALSMHMKDLTTVDGFDVTLTGFAEHEIQPMLIGEWKPPAIDETPIGTETEKIHSPGNMLRVEFNQEQMVVVQRAVDAVRKTNDKMTVAEVLVDVCRQWLK
jgi:hypothetical protein